MINKVLYLTLLMWSVSAKIFVMESEDLAGFLKSMPKSTGDMGLEHSAEPKLTEAKKRSLYQISNLFPAACNVGGGNEMIGFAKRPDLKDAMMIDYLKIDSCQDPIPIDTSQRWYVPAVPEMYYLKDILKEISNECMWQKHHKNPYLKFSDYNGLPLHMILWGLDPSTSKIGFFNTRDFIPFFYHNNEVIPYNLDMGEMLFVCL